MVGMETALLCSVASGTLKVVTNKLAPLLIKEYSSIVGVTQDLKELYELVQEINSSLETVGSTTVGNGPSFNWLKQLKEVAYAVDDVIDEFHLEAEKHDVECYHKHIVPKYLRTKSKSILLQCKAAHNIKAIKKKLDAVVKQRTDFSAIANSIPGDRSIRHTIKTAGEIPSLHIVDEATAVGRDQEKHQIISKLVQTNDQQKIKIASIFGLGSSGKTTSAKLIFIDGNIEKHFDIRLWVHVSLEFDVAKLIEKLFEAIVGEKPERHSLQKMSNTIVDNLAGKRYLLVLDDVWTKDRIQWEQVMVHFKSGAPGSRILLTTRNREVMEEVESAYPFDLEFLSKAAS